MPLGIQCNNNEDCENLNMNYYDYILQNLKGRDGKDGQKGPEGDQGDQGIKGEKGENGKEGQTIDQGDLNNIIKSAIKTNFLKIALKNQQFKQINLK